MQNSLKTSSQAYLNPQAMRRTWQVPTFLGGIRADQYLTHQVQRISRTRAQKLIQAGDFRAQSGPLKSSRRLIGGEKVELWFMPPDSAPTNLPHVPIVFQNNDFVVVDKPSGLVVHPTAKYLYHTLTYWFSRKFPKHTPHPCHRIDRETSGLLLAACDSKVQSKLKTAFMEGRIEKTYLALVEGRLDKPLDLNYPLALQGERGLVRIRMIQDNERGLPSQTLVKPVQYDPFTNLTLVECKPKTGRQHQIRAHLSIAGFPILGDKLYSMGDQYFDDYTKHKIVPFPGHTRQALHAHRLSFELDGAQYAFVSPIPADMRKLLTK